MITYKYKGRKLSIQELVIVARQNGLNLNATTIRNRINGLGWSAEKATNIPKFHR